jgi:ABC-type multidrug transport system ATPase subunit
MAGKPGDDTWLPGPHFVDLRRELDKISGSIGAGQARIPTRGIDVGAKYEIYTIINRLADSGKGVLMISSELPELLGVCDRIYTLSEGRITGCLDRDEATQESLMHLMTLESASPTQPDTTTDETKKDNLS